MAERICSIPECSRKPHGRGLCSTHYLKAYRSGELSVPPVDRSAHHRLTSVDLDNLTAVCSVCGPTRIEVRHKSGGRRERYCPQGPSRDTGPRTTEYRRREHFRREYGLTPEAVDEMRDRQEGRCAICGGTPPKLFVDHCHSTGKVRALLCHGCNSGIGHFRENTDALLAAVRYLHEHQEAAAK